MAKRIETIEELKELAQEDKEPEFYILLNGGLISRKRIVFNDDRFYIMNWIDETEQELSEKDLFSDLTNIGKALKNKCLFWEGE